MDKYKGLYFMLTISMQWFYLLAIPLVSFNDTHDTNGVVTSHVLRESPHGLTPATV